MIREIDIVTQLNELSSDVRLIPWSGWYFFTFRSYKMVYIPDDSNSMIRICIPFFDSIKRYNRDIFISAIEETNREVKYVKVIVLDNGKIALNYDHKLDMSNTSALILKHMLSSLFYAAEHLKRKILKKISI